MTHPHPPPQPPDSLQLLPTVLQQLPTLLSKPSLASTVFLAVRKSSTAPSPIITPLLAPLTAVALAASSPSLRQDAIATSLSLVRSLVSRRRFPLVRVYVTDLVQAAYQLIQYTHHTPLTTLLPNFVANAALQATTDQERQSLRALNIPPVPVSPASLEALLYLLASLVPAEQPPQPLRPAPHPSDFPSTIDGTAVRLWIGIGAAARTAVLDLASRYPLLSSRCGDLVAGAAVSVLERACHPVAGVVVPLTTRERLLAVLHDILVEDAGNQVLRGRLYALARLVSKDGCLPLGVWAQVGVREAVRGEGEVGRLLRGFSRKGYVHKNFEEPNLSEVRKGRGEPPKKRRRVEENGSGGIASIQEAFSQGSALFEVEEGVSLTPIAALTKELAKLETIYVCVEHGDAMRVLVRVLEITADALESMREEPLRQTLITWLAFVHSLTEIVRDVCGNIKIDGTSDLWLRILQLGLACIRLAKLLSRMRRVTTGVCTGYKVLSRSDVATDSQIFLGPIVSILNFAGRALDLNVQKLPLATVATLMWEWGELMRWRDFAHISGEQFSNISKVGRKFRTLALKGAIGLEESVRGTLLECAIHMEVSVPVVDRCKLFQEVFSELCAVVEQNKSECPHFASFALLALSDLLCFKLGCPGNHASNLARCDRLDAANTSQLDAQTWTELFELSDPIVKGAGMDELISAATQCLGTLLIHSPRNRSGEVSSALVKALWHPTSNLARKVVIPVISSIMSIHSTNRTDQPRDCILPHSNRLSPRDQEDSWDDFEIAVAGNEHTEAVIRLLGLELNTRLEKWRKILNKECIPELEALDFSSIAMILGLDGDDFVIAKIRGLAMNILLVSSAVELKAYQSSLQQYTNQMNRNITIDSPWEIMNFKAWNCLIKQASVNSGAEKSESHGLTVIGKSKRAAVHAHFPRDIVRVNGPTATTVANFLNSRSQEWLPYVLSRMLASDCFAQQIADFLLLQDTDTLWRKVPRHTVGALLRNTNAATLNALAMRVGKTRKELAEQICADALARVLMAERDSINLSARGTNSLLFEALEMPLKEAVAKREGKIVQRIIMDIGGYRDAKAREALASLSKIVQPNSLPGTDENVSGMLVSNHFMLVMDAVNRGLFHSKATKKDRARFVRMLDGVLSLARSHLHLFVPKILATLKMALDIDPIDSGFRSVILSVWRNFLTILTAKRALPHLGSILSILLPLLHEYDELLSPVLEELLEESSPIPSSTRSEVIVLLRIVNQPSLQNITRVLESEMSTGPLELRWRNDHGNNLNAVMDSLGRECENIGSIISQHANGVIEILAGSYLLNILRSHRAVLDKVLQTCSEVTFSDDNGSIEAVASLLMHLVSMLNKSKNTECQEKLLQCIGEVGALDPAVVQKFSKEYSPSEMRVVDPSPSYNCTVQSLVSTLLANYLIPALVRGEQRERSNNHLNRVGLVIQELLRICGCRRETATRARKVAHIRRLDDPPVDWEKVLVGDTEEENGIFFWENLDAATRTVAQPYLAEPFDVQHYKAIFGGTSAGNVELASQPVWSKVKAATATGVAASAQEWRRQLVVQLADYIGKQGKFGRALKALRPVLRYDDNIATFIFPFAVTDALDLQGRNGGKELQEFLVKEFSLVLKQCTSPQPVFDIFDTLRIWREARCKTRGSQIYIQNQNYGSTASSGIAAAPKRRVSIEVFIHKERKNDTLSPLVNLDGGEMPALSLLTQARAAFTARSYARTVMLAECFIRNSRASRGIPNWASSIRALRVRENGRDEDGFEEECEAFSLLQKSFAELEDPDSMNGISFFRPKTSLADTIIDAEAAGRHDEALITYERAISQTPRAYEMHEGFLRCLMTLGHWETMLSHAEGLVSSARLGEVKLRECSQALGIDAAWRLGRWEAVEELSRASLYEYEGHSREIKRSWNLDFNLSLGKMFVSLRDGDVRSLKLAAAEVRGRLLPTISRLAREGYARAYPAIVQLQMLSEVEDAIHMIGIEQELKDDEKNPCGHLLPLVSLKGREIATAPSLRVKEPILSARRVCFEHAGRHSRAAYVSLRLAELAHKTENLRAASVYAFQASTTPSVESNILNEAVVRMAQVAHANGDASRALLTVKEEIERLSSVKAGKPAEVAVKDGTNFDRLCTAYLLVGRWIEEARSEPSDVILDYFREATVHGPSRVEPFYALGRHFDALLQAGANSEAEIGMPKDPRAGRRGMSSSAAGNSFLQSSHYVPEVITSFTRALCNGHSRLFEALPRMLTVWFDYHTAVHCPDSSLSGSPVENSVNREMKKAFKSIPLYMWMTAIPQLMSRLLHPRKTVHDELLQLLARVFAAFPEQSSWLILPSTFVQSVSRKKAANDILKITTQYNRKLKKRGIADVKAALDGELERLRNLRVKVAAAYNVIQFFVDVCVTTPAKDKRGRMENCASEFSRLRRILQKSGNANPIVPTLETLTVQLPSVKEGEHRPFAKEPTTIVDIDNNALVMSSLMRPRRISLIGNDGKHYRFLVKQETSGDMRKDSRLVEFIIVLNRLLSKDPISWRRDLELKTYAVLPLTEEAGMIEWVNDLDPLRKLVRDQQASLPCIPDSGMIQKRYTAASDKKHFFEWVVAQCPPVLDKFFMQRFGGGTKPDEWLKARNLWTRSVAVWSMAGYIVGLGDRHGENVLIETTTGRCVHVDFAMLFGKGLTLKVPEIVPFRLTPNMVTAMGIAGYEGNFRIICEVVMGIMRRNSDALLGVLETFLHDPLADWGKGDTRNANGTVVGNKEAWQTRAAVKAKLTGMVDSSGLPLSIKGQVERLIHEATSFDNLSKMYIWWSGWI